MHELFRVRSSKCLKKYGKMSCDFILKEDHDAEVLAKDAIIKQMRDALFAAIKVADRATVEFDMVRAAVKL